jgi:ADP-heptose:LPS heptosyltransferase
MRKVILRNGQSPGDILTMTRAVADLKESHPDFEIDVRTPCGAIWENNPHLTPLKDDEAEIFDIGYDEINDCGWKQEHWTDAWRHDIEKKLKVKIKKTGIVPELWISDQEKSWYNQVHCDFNDDSPYWVINAGRKQDNELKMYHRWQEVADVFNDYFKGKVKLVQIGQDEHLHPPLKGVLDLRGKTDLRQLIRLAYNAQGSVGPLSLQFVLSAALKQPAVVVAGGKEDVRWHLYPHIKYIYSNGSLPCCEWGGCWLGGEKGNCKNLVDGVPKCFQIIEPYQIFDAIKSYYIGGRL